MKEQYHIARVVLRKFYDNHFKSSYEPVLQPEQSIWIWGISKETNIYFSVYGLGRMTGSPIKKFLYKCKHRVLYKNFKKSNHYGEFGCKVEAEIYK